LADLNATRFAASQQMLLCAQAIIERHRGRGELFNVFEILDRATDEVKGHSAFIADLLNPRGSHGQGTAFLKIFLQRALGLDSPIVQELGKDQDGHAWQVWTEVSFRSVSSETTEDTGSRIDIAIEGPDSFIIIENKIYAEDVPRQLERYHRFANERGKSQVAVLYLTLDGCEPSKDSLGDLPLDEVTLLSYAEDITQWLQDCIQAVALLPAVRETLRQYLDVLRRLTTGSLHRELIMEVKNLITSPDSFRAALAISAAAIEVQVQTLTNLFQRLQKRLIADVKRPTLDQSRHPYEANNQRVREYYSKSRNKPRDFGIAFPLFDLDSGRQVAFTVEVHTNLYYGLRLVTKGGEANSAEVQEPCKELLKMMRGIDPAFQEGKSSLIAWRYPRRGKLCFESFDEPCIRLVENEELDAFVAELSDEICCVLDEIMKPHKAVAPYLRGSDAR